MLVLAVLLLALSPPSASLANAADPGRPVLAVDMAAYLSTADMVWHWNATGVVANSSRILDPLAPTAWWTAAYIGNGLIGASVTAEVAGSTTPALRIDVGRTDVFAGENRMPVGWLTLAPAVGSLQAVDMRLVLANATLIISLYTSAGAASLQLFANAADPMGANGVIVATTTALRGSETSPRWTWTPDNSGLNANTTVINGTDTQTAWGTPAYYFVQTTHDGTYSTAFTSVAGRGGDTLVLTVANSQRSKAPTSSLSTALASLAASIALDPSAHMQWWTDFWAMSYFSFDTLTRVEVYAVIASYRYASAARFSMSDLMGPWGPGNIQHCIGPWCQFVWDMNQQVMLYLPSPSNRGAMLALPALDMTPFFLNGTWTAVFGSNSPPRDQDTLWWLANLHRYVLMYADEERMLNVLYPALRYILEDTGLVNGTDGLLHVQNCRSPEYTVKCPNQCMDCTYHLAIFRWAAQTAELIAAVHSPSDPMRRTYIDIINRLAPYPVDPATGSWEVAAGLPYAVPHRHYSHLLHIYDLQTTNDTETMANSLDVYWSITCSGPQAAGHVVDSNFECRGFTQAAMSAMSGILNRRAAAVGNLTALVDLVGLPNGMYGEEVYGGNPSLFAPVSESAYSGAATLYGLLVASGTWPPGPAGSFLDPTFVPHIRVWPSAPWANTTVYRLRTYGALLVSAVREGGATSWIALEAEAGASDSLVLTCEDWEGVDGLSVVSAEAGVQATPIPGVPGSWRVSGLTGGSAVALYPTSSGAPAGGFVVQGVQGRNATEYNYFGGRWVYNVDKFT